MNTTELFARFAKLRVAVIGDLIIDITTTVEPLKNLDDGTPVYRRILDPRRQRGAEYSLGGAGLVVRNLLELGATVEFITGYGYGEGALIVHQWKQKGLTLRVTQMPKQTTIKNRIWHDGKKLMQLDTVDNSEPSPYDADCVIMDWARALENADVAIVADYRHGLITEKMAKEIVTRAADRDVPLYVASQVSQAQSNHHWYDAVDVCFVLNETEAKCFKPVESVCTLGANGARYLQAADGTIGLAQGLRIYPVDVCGAGDAFLAAFALSEIPRRQEDLEFANTWAALSCLLPGANPPPRHMAIEWYAKQAALAA